MSAETVGSVILWLIVLAIVIVISLRISTLKEYRGASKASRV